LSVICSISFNGSNSHVINAWKDSKARERWRIIPNSGWNCWSRVYYDCCTYGVSGAKRVD